MQQQSPLRIFIAEDHPIVCEGFERLAERHPHWQIEGFAATAGEALEACRRLRPNLFVVDLSLSEGDGLELIAEVRKVSLKIRILVMSLYSEDEFARRAFQLGASGYVMKSRGLNAVGEAIQRVAEGDLYFSEHVLLALGDVRDGTQKSVADLLTSREMRVFQLVGKGLTPRAITRELGISVKTVETHRENIKNKLNLHSGLELNQRAYAWVRSLREQPGLR